MKLPAVEPMFTCREVAEHLKLSESHVRMLVRDEVLPAVVVGTPGATRQHVRITATAVQRFIDARCSPPNESQRTEAVSRGHRTTHSVPRRVGELRSAGWALEVSADATGALLLRWRDGLDTHEARCDDRGAAVRLARDLLAAVTENDE